MANLQRLAAPRRTAPRHERCILRRRLSYTRSLRRMLPASGPVAACRVVGCSYDRVLATHLDNLRPVRPAGLLAAPVVAPSRLSLPMPPSDGLPGCWLHLRRFSYAARKTRRFVAACRVVGCACLAQLYVPVRPRSNDGLPSCWLRLQVRTTLPVQNAPRRYRRQRLASLLERIVPATAGAAM